MKRILFALLFLPITLFSQNCYEFDRYVSGNYFDTYEICTEDIYIDLQDFTSDCALFCISPVNGLNYATGNQNIGNNQWRQFYRNVTVAPSSDISLNSFVFNTHDNWQSFNFTLSLEGTVFEANEFVLNNQNYRNYFSMDCESALAVKSADFIFQGQPPAFNGTISGEHITIQDGNNTSIQFSECCLLKADTLTLVQSAQNNVKIDGHIIAERLESEASLYLQYDDAVVTIGELPNNAKIFGNENTTVNLCLNKTAGADKFGYFKGTIMYNSGARGWSTTPSEEGDINFNDNGSDYWTWRNSGKAPEEIAAYNSFDECIDEYINITQCIKIEEKHVEEKQFQLYKINKYTVLGQRLGTATSSEERKNEALILK